MTISFKLFSISRKYFNSNSKGWIKAESEFNCRKKVHLIFGMKKKYITYEETVKKIKYIILSIQYFPNPDQSIKKVLVPKDGWFL